MGRKKKKRRRKKRNEWVAGGRGEWKNFQFPLRGWMIQRLWEAGETHSQTLSRNGCTPTGDPTNWPRGGLNDWMPDYTIKYEVIRDNGMRRDSWLDRWQDVCREHRLLGITCLICSEILYGRKLSRPRGVLSPNCLAGNTLPSLLYYSYFRAFTHPEMLSDHQQRQ